MKKLAAKNKLLLFTLSNLFLFVSTIIVTYITLSYGTVAGQVDTGEKVGWFYIATFTVLSNILLGIVALFAMIAGFKKMRKKVPFSKSLSGWYLVASTATMLTFLVVIFYLAPMRAMNGKNYFEMLMGPMFFFHFFNPVLAALTFIFLLDDKKTTNKHCLLTLLPPIIYAAPYLINVVIFPNWPDFYGFTFGGRTYITPFVITGILLFVYGIAKALSSLHNHRLSC